MACSDLASGPECYFFAGQEGSLMVDMTGQGKFLNISCPAPHKHPLEKERVAGLGHGKAQL